MGVPKERPGPRPEPWHKGRNSLTGHGDPIIIPRDSDGEVHCQGEAVAVIGRNCRRVSPVDARRYILGYACGNDVCDQTWQREDTTVWRARGSDTFAPVGPWIETDSNPQELDLIVRLNGEEVQRVNTRDMLFTFAEIVSCHQPAGDPPPRRPGIFRHRCRHQRHQAGRCGGGGDTRNWCAA